MSYFGDEITQADVDYIFENKPYVKSVDFREQFFADLAARQPGAYQQMQADNSLGTDATYQSLSDDVHMQRRMSLNKAMQDALLAAPVEEAGSVFDEYAEEANKQLTMREAFYEQQNIPLQDDLEIARNLLAETSARIPTNLVNRSKARATTSQVGTGGPLEAIAEAEREQAYYESLSGPEKQAFLQEEQDIASAKGGLLRSIPAFTLAWASQSAKEVTGQQSFLYGNAVEALAKHIYYSTDRQKATEDVIASVRKHSGIVAENEFDVASTLDLINDYVGKIDEGTTEEFTSKFQNIMLNTFGVLDMVPDFIPGLNNATKIAKANNTAAPLGKGLDTPLADIAAHNKEAGDTLASIALQEPSGQAAGVLGVSKEQAAINSVPGFEADGMRVAGQNATKELRENVTAALQAAEESTPASLMQFVDATKQQDQLKGVLTQLPADGHLPPYQSDLTLSVFQKSDDGFLRYGSVYGQADGSSFSTLQAAQEAAERIKAQFGAGPFETTGVDILGRIGNGNVWAKATDVQDATEFKVQLNVKQRMRWETDHVIPQEAITPALALSKYFQNIHATMSSDYVVPLSAANETASKLQSYILRINEPMFKLNEFKKQGVLKAIVDGGEQERVFNDTELVSLYKLDSDQIAAYHSERAMWDTIHHIKNKEEYTAKLAEGYVRIQSNADDGTQAVDTMGKAVDLQNFTGVEKVAVVDKGQVTIVSKAEAEQFQAQGYQAYALADAHVAEGDKRYKFMLAKPTEHIKPLPEQMLPYRKGYYYKINKGKYFVEKEFKGELNGVPHTFKRAVAIADSPGAAELAVKQGVGDSFKVDENIVNNHDFADWIEINTPSTGYWYTARQPQMPTYSTDLSGALQRITSQSEDPIAAAEAAAAKVSNFVAWRDVIKTYEQLHKNTYPELWTSDGARSLYLGTQAADNTPRIRSANAMFEHMTSLTSYASQVDATWNNWMVSADRLFSNHRLGAHTSKLFLDAGVKANPARLLTTGTYYTQVVSAPFRQFMLNIVTPTLYAGVAPVTWAKSVKEAYLVYAKLTGGHLPLRGVQIDNALRNLKGEVDDITEVARQFVRSGKVDTLDSHVQLHNEMLKAFKGGSSSKTEALFRESVKPLKKVVSFVREQGVIKGELYNKIFSFVFAKNIMKADKNFKGLWHDKLNLEKISNKANQLGLDMTKVGAYGYQAGLTRPLTQFLGVMHQAMAALIPPIPGIIRGNRAYDGKRAAVMLGLFALWGAQGLPFSPDELIDGVIKQQLKDRGIDLSVLDNGTAYALMEIITRGAIGAAIAEGIRLATGQDERVSSELSATLSPAAAGANPFVERLLTAEGSLLELLSGPSLTMMKNVSSAAQNTRLLFYGYKPEELSQEKLKDILLTWAAIMPSMSNFMQASSTISYRQKVDDYYSFNKKDVRLRSNIGEQLVKAFWGIKPHNEQTFYDMLQDKKQMEESVKQDVNALKGLWLRISTDKTLTEEQKLAKIAGISTVLSHNSLYNSKVLDTLRVELANDESLAPVVEAFISGKLLDTPEKSLEDTRRELERFFLSNPLVPKKQQQQILEMVDSFAEDANFALELDNATTNRP